MAVCKRLLPCVETVDFISPFLQQEHILKGINDELNTPKGWFLFFNALLSGIYLAYGVFETDPCKFLGFQLLCPNGTEWENHAFWNRHVDTVFVVNLCKHTFLEDCKRENIPVTALTAYIPDINFMAQRLAVQCGMTRGEITSEKVFIKNGIVHNCRIFKENVNLI